MNFELNFISFLIVCPLVFLSGFVDAIGGGGGLISLPAYVFAGLPMYAAIGTNKLSSSIGTLVSTIRYCRHTTIDWKLIIPCIVLSLAGSACGSNLTLVVDEQILEHLLLILLPIAAFFVFRKNAFTVDDEHPVSYRKKCLISWAGAFAVGAYDGFYGPGTGTFMLIILISFAKMRAMEAATTTKLINQTSNITSMVVFLMHGQSAIVLGLVSAVFSMAGHYVGSGLLLKNGEKVVRPIILCVLIFLFVKIITGQ